MTNQEKIQLALQNALYMGNDESTRATIRVQCREALLLSSEPDARLREALNLIAYSPQDEHPWSKIEELQTIARAALASSTTPSGGEKLSPFTADTINERLVPLLQPVATPSQVTNEQLAESAWKAGRKSFSGASDTTLHEVWLESEYRAALLSAQSQTQAKE